MILCLLAIIILIQSIVLYNMIDDISILKEEVRNRIITAIVYKVKEGEDRK